MADIRKNNVLLAATLDKSHSWALSDGELSVTVSTAMERDLLKRFLGIIAEMLSLRMGAPSRLDVVMGGAASPGDDPFEGPGAGAARPSPDIPDADLSRSAPQRMREVPASFNERPQSRAAAAPRPDSSQPGGRQSDGRSPGRVAAPGTVAASPATTPAEREAIGMVERLFKGSLAGFAAANSAPASAGIGLGSGAKASPGGRADSADADDRAAVYEPERYDGDAIEA